MTEIPQPCPCCNVEKHQATVSSCIKAAKTTQETTQERLRNTIHCVCVKSVKKKSQKKNRMVTSGQHKMAHIKKRMN